MSSTNNDRQRFSLLKDWIKTLTNCASLLELLTNLELVISSSNEA